MRIVVDDKIPFLKGALEPYAEVVYKAGDQIENSDLRDAEALLVRSITRCNRELLEDTRVRLIASATIGDDHIDKEYCESAGIEWNTAKGCNASAVNQYIQVALHNLAKSIGVNLQGLTLAVIGVGNIGAKVARSANKLGMEVLLYDPPREEKEGGLEFAALHEICKEADVVSMHVPLTKMGRHKTDRMVNTSFLNAFEKPIVFLNTSRGDVVETRALIQGLKSGRVKATAIDVWGNEPDIDLELLELAKIATPHIAGYSEEGKRNGTAMTLQSLNRFFNLGIEDLSQEIAAGELELTIDCKELTENQILDMVYGETYDILKETAALKNAPENFQLFRRNYQFRLENHQILLDLKNCKSTIIDILLSLGFKLKNN